MVDTKVIVTYRVEVFHVGSRSIQFIGSPVFRVCGLYVMNAHNATGLGYLKAAALI